MDGMMNTNFDTRAIDVATIEARARKLRAETFASFFGRLRRAR